MCWGLSVGIVLECDLIVAEEGTQFQITETSRGLGAGKYWALMHYRGGGAFTMEAALTGRFFTAEEAHKANLINRVAPKGQYLEVARGPRRAGAQEPAAQRALDGAHAASLHGSAEPRGHVHGRTREALSQRGFPGSCPRLRREAQAGQVQGTLT
jgi:enoyl-CoA hydratase/carnithine racemase